MATALVAILVVAFGACTEPADERTPVAAGTPSTQGRPLPPLKTPQRWEELDKKGAAGVRAWPASRDAEQGVEYVYETGHCGLNHNLDFDGSFWRAVNPFTRRQPSFFINYDKGHITLVSEDEARYEASNGIVVELRRIDGPMVVPYCA